MTVRGPCPLEVVWARPIRPPGFRIGSVPFHTYLPVDCCADRHSGVVCLYPCKNVTIGLLHLVFRKSVNGRCAAMPLSFRNAPMPVLGEEFDCAFGGTQSKIAIAMQGKRSVIKRRQTCSASNHPGWQQVQAPHKFNLHHTYTYTKHPLINQIRG